MIKLKYLSLRMFQSTRPRGARPVAINIAAIFLNVSIHAPARGATTAQLDARLTGRVSIHAPARGATPLNLPKLFLFVVSIHAPARGATPEIGGRL